MNSVPPLPFMYGLNCSRSVQVSLTGSLQMINFYFLESLASLAVRTDMFVFLLWVEGSQGLGFPRSAYRNRFSPAPSSQCGRCILILCFCILDP